MGDNAPTGLLPGGSASLCLYSEPQFDEKWSKCELITAGLIQGIQPSRQSEGKRRAIIDYVERLIQRHFNCQVSTYGSVPLKTYLPDGDIDLSTFSWLPHSSEIWANELCHLLKREEHNKHAKFCVKEVQIINAEVQIVKCLVDNVIVDISFNQLGGICTLCFLEEVDRFVGKDHLFKRSVILVKAWCYYESRILGAHYGLISTYALETLVLYIFNIFHASIRGPFEVLCKFLQFFSQFDWKLYCVSLRGPIPLTALHEMNAEPPNEECNDLLFSHDFLSTCSHVYGFSIIGAQELQARNFSSKNMNVVDPLRFDNNLGRSVNRGNFFRICSALAYGAKQIERIFHGPPENVLETLDEFFRNTKKHCNAYRPDAFAPRFTDMPSSATSGWSENSEDSGEEVADKLSENLHGASQNGNRELARIKLSNETTKFTLAIDKMTPTSKLKLENNSSVSSAGNERPPARPSRLEALETATRKKKSSYNNANGVLKQADNSTAADMISCYRENAENARDLSSTSEECNGNSHEADCSSAVASHCPAASMPVKSSKADDFSAMLMINSPDSNILTGNFGAYLMNLHYCRWMVASQFYAPMTFTPPFMYTGRQMFEPFACEGPGRPTNGSINVLTQAFPYNYEQYMSPPFQGLSLQNASAMPSNRMFQGELQKSHRGTGTYLPNFRPGKYRDTRPTRNGRVSSNASKVPDWNGAAGHDETNGFLPRFLHGGGKLERCFSVNSQPDKRSALEQSRQENGHLMPVVNPPKFLATNSANAGGNNMKFTSQAADYFTAAVSNHREKEPLIGDMLTPSLQTPLLGSFSNNNEGCLLTESLEFGSLGPGFLGNSKKVLVYDGGRRDQDGWRSQSSQSLKGGDTTDNGEVTAKKMLFSDNQQSSLKRCYELKEEDFPPLSTSSQIGKSTTPLSAQKDSITEWPHLQACVTDSSIWNSPNLQESVDR
ncbi:hypothetical protein GOP47_0015294 [Adiantum capillus-veneris]|uniref:Polymerase nucleotidyl transferase domain-containing protein n=1 Tax=Adiantum capillus-veneris TaxID=13818 RepID=A0A9D4ZB52_ADICA|nr:hypothetical protein GOP47_0015294 [Adiantum capillus-veneris]